MRYYSTQRSVTPGSCPKDGIKEIVNFEKRIFCNEIGREAWGYIDYDHELSATEAETYELVQEGIAYWTVTIASKKQGGGLKVMIDKNPVRTNKFLVTEQWENNTMTFKRHIQTSHV